MTKKQHYMTEHERYKLEAYLQAGRGVSWIARKLGFYRQTIYNEIKRGAYLHTVRWWDEVRYSAEKAQQKFEYAQTAKGRPLKIGSDRKYADFLERKMLGVQDSGKVDRRKRYSPAAALELARREGFETSVCVGKLYSYIDKRVFLNLSNKDLWEKGKPRKQGYKPVRRVAHPALPSIVDRPEIINQRRELGHKEIDLIVGCEGSKAATLTITDRKGRTELAYRGRQAAGGDPRNYFLYSRRLRRNQRLEGLTTASILDCWVFCCSLRISSSDIMSPAFMDFFRLPTQARVS